MFQSAIFVTWENNKVLSALESVQRTYNVKLHMELRIMQQVPFKVPVYHIQSTAQQINSVFLITRL